MDRQSESVIKPSTNFEKAIDIHSVSDFLEKYHLTSQGDIEQLSTKRQNKQGRETNVLSTKGREMADKFFLEFFSTKLGDKAQLDMRIEELQKYIFYQKSNLLKLSGEQKQQIAGEIAILEKMLLSTKTRIRSVEAKCIQSELSATGNEWGQIVLRWKLINQDKFKNGAIDKFAQNCFGVSINKLRKSLIKSTLTSYPKISENQILEYIKQAEQVVLSIESKNDSLVNPESVYFWGGTNESNGEIAKLVNKLVTEKPISVSSAIELSTDSKRIGIFDKIRQRYGKTKSLDLMEIPEVDSVATEPKSSRRMLGILRSLGISAIFGLSTGYIAPPTMVQAEDFQQRLGVLTQELPIIAEGLPDIDDNLLSGMLTSNVPNEDIALYLEAHRGCLQELRRDGVTVWGNKKLGSRSDGVCKQLTSNMLSKPTERPTTDNPTPFFRYNLDKLESLGIIGLRGEVQIPDQVGATCYLTAMTAAINYSLGDQSIHPFVVKDVLDTLADMKGVKLSKDFQEMQFNRDFDVTSEIDMMNVSFQDLEKLKAELAILGIDIGRLDVTASTLQNEIEQMFGDGKVPIYSTEVSKTTEGEVVGHAVMIVGTQFDQKENVLWLVSIEPNGGFTGWNSVSGSWEPINSSVLEEGNDARLVKIPIYVGPKIDFENATALQRRGIVELERHAQYRQIMEGMTSLSYVKYTPNETSANLQSLLQIEEGNG